MNNAQTAATSTTANHASHIVSDGWLAIQDEFYATRRLPEPTPEGAEDRTYCFRVEFSHDLLPLRWMLNWAIEKWWSSPVCPGGDADAKVTLKPGALSLKEIRWLFDKVADCHVAVQTVALEDDYTGERTYLEADEMGAKVPRASTLRKCLEGLAEWREGLAANADRAIEAEVEIEFAIEAQVALKAERKQAKR